MYTKARTCAHACELIHLYVKDLAEAELDMIGQQISPYTFRMEPDRLRRDYGDMMSFWGGIDTQVVLVNYTPDQIRDWVRRVMYALAPGHVVPTRSLNTIVRVADEPGSIGKEHAKSKR